MKFKPTEYTLKTIATGREFEDAGWTLSDSECKEPSLVRAVYKTKQFTPRNDLKGLYRYAEWLPINHTLKNSAAPVTFKSEGLSKVLGMDNLFITFSGYNPKIGAEMETCSFKETEAYSVCGRLPEKDNHILVIQSAGNTARAFAKVCSDNNIPLVICIPNDCIHDLWFRKELKPCVKVIATPNGTDYYDAIALGDKLGKDPIFLVEGGAKNVARRDGMGTTVLSAIETIGRIPDAYFQAIGSGTGAIAAWENNLRLIEDGRFGKNKMKIFAVQNAPFTVMYDAWKAGSRELLPITPEQSRRRAEMILAKVLSNRKPPYSLKGGLFDALTDSKGDIFVATNDEIVYWMLQFFNTEGFDIMPASAAAVAAVSKALKSGQIDKHDTVMINVTGGGLLGATSKGFVMKKADLIVKEDIDAEEFIEQVKALFPKTVKKAEKKM